MKSGDSEKRDVLRMIDSAIKNKEIESKKREEGLDDQEIVSVISHAAKQRKDSIEQYEKGGRSDLAEKEAREIEILAAYLPEQMSEEELSEIVEKVVSDCGTDSKKEFGKIMGIVMGKVRGRADGNVVKDIIEKKLQ